MCVLVIFEKEKNSTVNYKSSTVCTSGVLLASNGENLVLRPNKILLKAHFLRHQPQIWNTTCLDLWFGFLAGLEFNMFHI